MKKKDIFEQYANQLEMIKSEGLFKGEMVITSPQSTVVDIESGKEMLNMCANNYLGLANNKRVVDAAKKSYDEHGYGMASVRFICGTQDIHKELEVELSDFLKTEDTILFSSCFDANGGLFETILSDKDAIISDELNHASIIDGIRLCKAKRYRYKNNNTHDLEEKLKQAELDGANIKAVVTDGVFSMDGIIANLKGICDVCEKYNALVIVDDSHAVGVIGEHARGSVEYCGVEGRVDIITGTLGKALGGASGGYVTGKKEVIQLLRQRSRPYLFSNSLAPPIVAASLEVIKILKENVGITAKLSELTAGYRRSLKQAGLEIIDGVHPIVPIMIYDEIKAAKVAEYIRESGIYVVAFSFPVVAKGKARIRTQVSATHTEEQLNRLVEVVKSAMDLYK